MQLRSYVKSMPWFFKFIPVLNKYTATSIYPYIFIPKDIYIDLKLDNPNPRHIALLIHEETHHKKQKDMGPFVFGIKYLFNPKFRFNEELLAIKEAMRYLKKCKLPFNFERSARNLSGYLYLWPVSKRYAEKELRQKWDEV